MNTAPPSVQTNSSLILLTPSGEPFNIQEAALKLVKDQDTLNECHLSFHISFDLYQRIIADALFHLKPELLNPTSEGELQPDSVIEITTTLQHQFLPSLPQQATDSATILAHLAKLSSSLSDQNIASEDSSIETENESAAEAPTDAFPLLQTESWFALYVKQQQTSTSVTYRTFWSYLSPSVLAKEVTSNGQISASMGHLFQNLATQDTSAAGAAISQAFDDLLQGLESWVDDQLSSAEETFTQLADEISQSLGTWLATDTTAKPLASPSKRYIYKAMLTFFSEDDWEFTKLKGDTILQLAFQGKNGPWNCFAIARDEAAQFLFYSICPQPIPADQRPAISEFIARANYGLVLGNFEFDLDSGEIRFKTSIDTTHVQIQPAIIQQLVYANVTLMDRYLPGILAVIEQAMNPQDAIQSIENADLG